MEQTQEHRAWIRALIAKKDLKKKLLARRCKISRPYLSEFLHGDRDLPEATVDRLLRELGVEREEKD